MLCSDLLLKDMETFKRDYDTYYLKQKNGSYERLYQEALMIYLAGTKAKPEEWANISSVKIFCSVSISIMKNGQPGIQRYLLVLLRQGRGA